MFSHQLGRIVLLNFVQLNEDFCEPGFAAVLPGADRPKDMQHFRGRNPLRLIVHPLNVVRGVLGIHPVRQPLLRPNGAAGAELNPAPHVRGAEFLVLPQWDMLSLDELNLQRNSKPVGGAPRAQSGKHLPRLDRFPARQRLQAVKIGHAGGIRFVRPRRPGRMKCFANPRVRVLRLRNNSRADRV